MKDDELLGGWHPDSIERLGAWAARHAHDVGTFLYGQRREIAIDAIVDFLLDQEEREGSGSRLPAGSTVPAAVELIHAAQAAITREGRHYRRDHPYTDDGKSRDSLRPAGRGWMAFWIGAPSAIDQLAEAVTERVAVRQLVAGLRPEHQEAVRAYARTIDDGQGGSLDRAAAALEMGEVMYRGRLVQARKTARALWVADDETPRGKWGHDRGPNHGRGGSITAVHIQKRRQCERKAAASEG